MIADMWEVAQVQAQLMLRLSPSLQLEGEDVKDTVTRLSRALFGTRAHGTVANDKNHAAHLQRYLQEGGFQFGPPDGLGMMGMFDFCRWVAITCTGLKAERSIKNLISAMMQLHVRCDDNVKRLVMTTKTCLFKP